MSANIPVLPIAGGALVRAFASLVALVTYWLKALARARRHRRDARILHGFNGHMLADIGVTRADLRDAFSAPFWEDPTALLRERAIERRMSRALTRGPSGPRETQAENGFQRPAMDRPARHAI